MSLINKGPSIRLFSNDSQLIDYINKISGNSYINIEDALTFINSNPNVYVQNSIVGFVNTEDLIYNVDAGQVASYPLGYNTWYDLTEYQNNATLLNGVTFNSDNEGYFSLDGNDDLIATSDIPISIDSGEFNTVDMWIYWNGTECNVFSFGNSNLGIKFSSSNFGFVDDNGLMYGISNSELANKWIHVTAIFPVNWGISTFGNSRIYINNIKQNLDIVSGTITNQSLTSPIDIEIGSSVTGGLNFNGDISINRIWKRKLTLDEISLNFMGAVSRYHDWILTSGVWDDTGLWIDNNNWID